MNHDDYREALALRLYGELEDEEAERLEAHLASCAECRVLAAELEAGLGRLVREPGPEPELPAGWETRLRSSIAARERRRAAPLWLSAAAGFAAGLLAMAAWSAPAGDPPRGPAPGLADDTTFALAAPPPRAESTGGLARIALYAGR